MSNPLEDARLWQVEAFGRLELLHAHLVDFTFSPHSHEEFMIAVSESGNGSPRFGGGVQPIRPGDVIVLTPGEIQSGGATGDSVWHYRAFYPPVALMQRAAQELTGADRGIPHFARAVFNDPAVVNALRRAHVALEEPSSALERESYLLEALACLVAQCGAGKLSAHPIGIEHRAVKLAKEYLESLPGENVTLEQLAQEVGLTPFHLCRVFRRENGLSPHTYQILVRLKRAKTLLAAGLPISQVALETGFFDQAHLTRHFKRVFGVTPGRYFSAGLSGNPESKIP
jgi:AraC-like DNA-binding protein